MRAFHLPLVRDGAFPDALPRLVVARQEGGPKQLATFKMRELTYAEFKGLQVCRPAALPPASYSPT